jgi:hypothetical protein
MKQRIIDSLIFKELQINLKAYVTNVARSSKEIKFILIHTFTSLI